MKLAITGATGFIGRYIVEDLLRQNFDVLVTGTNREKASTFPWFKDVEFIEIDLNKTQPESVLKEIATADKLLHLAWSGLPNYKSLFHFEQNLMPQYYFLKNLINLGVLDITITGTCFEYGKKNGCLTEEMETNPENSYALAKDTLHNFLKELQKVNDFKLKWVRLFYMHGTGQAESSILSQLDNAIQNNMDHFNMSAGEQIRDYLSVQEVASKLGRVALHPEFNGTINCCSGKGISIRNLVENHLREKKYELKLNLGFYPYNDYEAFEFWGDNSKWNSIFE